LARNSYQIEKAIQIICNIADEIIVAEPNGYNPVLKIMEKVSPYHIQHEEKSYALGNETNASKTMGEL
jgi:hypothetical protein